MVVAKKIEDKDMDNVLSFFIILKIVWVQFSLYLIMVVGIIQITHDYKLEDI